jgi:prolyl-tRNA editing enzyme YbaK/EbsC (Cys-tRNA(Pro) deacylase)
MNLSSTSQKFQDHLNKLCPDLKVVEYSQGARTAEDAAKAIDCEVGQIAKSLVFKGTNTGKPYIFIVSGPNRLNEQKMTDVVGEEIEKADADFVKEKTGFSIGGIPPFAHPQNFDTYLDKDLLNYDFVWAAAGMPQAVFKIKPANLMLYTKAGLIETD